MIKTLLVALIKIVGVIIAIILASMIPLSFMNQFGVDVTPVILITIGTIAVPVLIGFIGGLIGKMLDNR